MYGACAGQTLKLWTRTCTYDQAHNLTFDQRTLNSISYDQFHAEIKLFLRGNAGLLALVLRNVQKPTKFARNWTSHACLWCPYRRLALGYTLSSCCVGVVPPKLYPPFTGGRSKIGPNIDINSKKKRNILNFVCNVPGRSYVIWSPVIVCFKS